MPSWYVHTAFNLIVFIPLLLFLKVFSIELILLILAWGVLIDLDHLPYFIYKLKTVDFSRILKYSNQDYASDTPHFYPLHTIDFFIAFGIVLYLRNFDLTLTLLFLAGLFHWILDSARHYIIHRNFSWLRYYSAIYHLFRNR